MCWPAGSASCLCHGEKTMSDPMATVTGETLDGVSATTLWTLRNRAIEAKRPDGVISDPWAIRLLSRSPTTTASLDATVKPTLCVRGVWRLMGWPALDRLLLSRISQRIIVLDFA